MQFNFLRCNIIFQKENAKQVQEQGTTGQGRIAINFSKTGGGNLSYIVELDIKLTWFY